mmetsp:Transcript_58703/g.132334  ORF Transcript_58703/g.132334 Transcript_58703/m.132334 type:complete len:457 (+) Transcript_58703:157-1527(+)
MVSKAGPNAASTYSFSSQPKPVAGTRKKYRDPGEDVTMYRDLKETCITWDKRVYRGNTYSIHQQKAVKDAIDEGSVDASPPKPRRKSRPKEPKIFDMPLPERERIPVDLTRHLVAEEVKVEVDTVEAQTDEFLPEEPPDMYQPQKTGIDVETQVEDGDLFVFDYEVEPILDVIVNKTLEQSIMEVEEEHELEQMQAFKEEWYQRQEEMMLQWQMQVESEWRRWGHKEDVVRQKREEKQREARVLLKIKAINAAKKHLKSLVPNAIEDLQEVAFPDKTGMAINQIFLPQLLQQAKEEVHALARAQRHVDGILAPLVQRRVTAQAEGLAAHSKRTAELEKRHHEETQIRQGRIRIHVDSGGGRKVAIGPIQISSADDIEVTQDRVFAWLQENEPSLSDIWPHGVFLLIDGEQVQETLEIFEAKAGQISVAPKPEPPPPTPSEHEDGEGEEFEEDPEDS